VPARQPRRRRSYLTRRRIAVTQAPADVTQKSADMSPRPQTKSISRALCVSAVNPLYCTVNSPHPMRRPARGRSRHRNLRCPHTVGAATVTKADDADPVAGVADTVTVAGFGTVCGGKYSPVGLTVPLPAATARLRSGLL